MAVGVWLTISKKSNGSQRVKVSGMLAVPNFPFLTYPYSDIAAKDHRSPGHHRQNPYVIFRIGLYSTAKFS